MKKFIDLGYKICFKSRPDENIEDQIEAYCLPQEYIDSIIIVEEITNDLMDKIDIIAGSMTSLVSQLLPYNKIIWVLETEYRFLENLVEEGYAHKICYEDIDKLDEKMFMKKEVDYNYHYSSELLTETLSKYVLD